MKLSLFLFGGSLLGTDGAHRTELLDLFFRDGTAFTGFSAAEDGSVSLWCSRRAAKRIGKQCAARGIPLTRLGESGLPALFRRYRARAGIFAGVLAAVLLLVLSRQYVWDVRVTGNSAMSAREVTEELRACGFGVGSYIPGVNTSDLETRVLIRSDRISWISVFLDGTVARVQIIENVFPPEEEPAGNPANLVAAADGQIEYLELFRGKSAVKVGQAVREGDLLVSGLYDSDLYGFRYTRAAGKVFARTERSYRVEIPLCYEKREYSKSSCASVLLNFFDFSLKIYKSTGNRGDTCDIIKKELGFDLPGTRDLPVYFTVTERVPYQTVPARRTPEEALTLAYAELSRTLSGLSADAQLLRKEIRTTLTDDALILDCTVLCVENIARQSEFEITELP